MAQYETVDHPQSTYGWCIYKDGSPMCPICGRVVGGIYLPYFCRDGCRVQVCDMCAPSGVRVLCAACQDGSYESPL